MTASGGDSGEKPQNEGTQGPSEGAYEATPIEQSQTPSGSGYDAPLAPPDAPAYTGYETPSGYPPPGYPPPSYPPPGYAPQPGYPPAPPQGGYPPQYGGSYPPSAPPPPQFGGQPYPAGYNYGAPKTGTNGLAIGALVASLIGFVPCFWGLPSIVGIVLGIVAMNQIKQTRQDGYGLAVAGIAVGAASLIIGFVLSIYAWR
jgi:hypothetical protein